jgi:cell division septum initiation protein DivIVA
MATDILSTIIEVEQQIHERLAAEQRSAGEMLERLRTELQHEEEREADALAASTERSVATARSKAERQAAAMVRHATARAEHLAGLDDGVLERYLQKYLAGIVARGSP